MKFKIEQVIMQHYAGRKKLISVRNFQGFAVKRRVWYGWKYKAWFSSYPEALHYVDRILPEASKDID